MGSPRAAALQPVGSPILVSLFMQGGVDGLSLLAPVGDSLYEQLRPTLATVAPGATMHGVKTRASPGTRTAS